MKFIDILRRHEHLASGSKSKRSKKYGKWMINSASGRKKYRILPKKWKAAGKYNVNPNMEKYRKI